MIALGWAVIIGCLVVYVVGSARRQIAASRGVRRQLGELLGMEDANDWPQPSVVAPSGATSGHTGVLAGATSTGRRLWLDLDSPYYRTTDFNFVAVSVDVGADVDDVRIAPGGAWTKPKSNDDSFRRRFNVSGVATLDPGLRDAVTATSPSAIEIDSGRLTVVTTRGQQPRLADAVRALRALAELIEALDDSYHGLADGVGDIGLDALNAAEHRPDPGPRDRTLNMLFAGTVIGAVLVLAG